MIPRVLASVDLSAIAHNFQYIRQKVGPSAKIMPMVKANAYGHGLIDVTHALPEADAFGVATINEAIRLRKSGITQAIFVMCGFRHPSEIQEFDDFQLTAVIHHPDQVTWLEQAAVQQPFSAWMKMDTGMHRLGMTPDEFAFCYKRLLRCPSIKTPVGVMTHMASADYDQDFTREQLTIFHQLVDDYGIPLSVCNSAGVLNLGNVPYHLSRPGIMLYGVTPIAAQTGQSIGLKPAMTLTSYIISYRTVMSGESIGYGRAWVAPENTPVGIVTAGYGDGYPRHAISGTPVIIHGRRCPIVGRISMDMLAVDLRPVSGKVQIGDEVILWGAGLAVEEVASFADTIPYEVLCQLTDRVTRQVISHH